MNAPSNRGGEMATARFLNLRPVLLMVVGALLMASLAVAAAFVLRGGTTTAATLYTRSSSCGANDFFPALSTDYYTLSPDDGVVIRGAPSNPTEFVCDPGLPNGGNVTRVDFTIRDNSTSGSVTKCGLYRSSLLQA